MNKIIHQTCNTDIFHIRNVRFCTGVLILSLKVSLCPVCALALHNKDYYEVYHNEANLRQIKICLDRRFYSLLNIKMFSLVSFIAIKHLQLSFDVAPMYKVHLSVTLLKSRHCMYKVHIYDIPQLIG